MKRSASRKRRWDRDLDKGYVSQVESGKGVPSLPALVALAHRLKVEPAT